MVATSRHSLLLRAFCASMPLLLARPVPRGDNGNGENEDDDPPPPSDGRGSGNHRRRNPADVVNHFNGDTVRMASQIVDVEADNYRVRRKCDELKRQVDALTRERDDFKGKLPGDDVVVLPKAKATALEAFEKLGTPEAVAAQLQSGEVAQREVALNRQNTVLERAANIVGFRPNVLRLLAKDLAVEVREVEVADTEGKISKVEKPFVVSKNGDQTTSTALFDFFKSQGEDVLQSLQKPEGEAQNAAGTQGSFSSGSPASGVAFPAQGAGGRANQNFDLSALDKAQSDRFAHVLPQKK